MSRDTDIGRTEQPRVNMPEAVQNMASAWMAMAEAASDIAHARRTIFLAYIAEGFAEHQALELIKSL